MRTKTYVMTVEKNSDEVLEQLNKLQQVKQSVSLLNKHSTKKHYVKCQGRWGRKNPDYNQRTIPFCPLDKAVKWDVYIYQARQVMKYKEWCKLRDVLNNLYDTVNGKISDWDISEAFDDVWDMVDELDTQEVDDE